MSHQENPQFEIRNAEVFGQALAPHYIRLRPAVQRREQVREYGKILPSEVGGHAHRRRKPSEGL